MHRWCACPKVMQPCDDELELEEPFRKPLQAIRKQLEEAERLWTIGDSELPLSYGLPLAPVFPAPAPDKVEIYDWGASSVPRPRVVYTDGWVRDRAQGEGGAPLWMGGGGAPPRRPPAEGPVRCPARSSPDGQPCGAVRLP